MDIGNKVLEQMKNKEKITTFERFEEIIALKKLSNSTCRIKLKYSDESKERTGTVVIGKNINFKNCCGNIVNTKDYYTFFFDETDGVVTQDGIKDYLMGSNSINYFNYHIEYIII